ncbi:hypothetical protein [Mesorhizobium retamae]|uniref:Holin of 3TMs, for gene-transfer release n=1 Tax=Mesorhizobium retamae TaxID=2912854 RepID=A0ABS9QHY2_9HYPH|nr:hypothetical protein [Mesorhizobium sp. IRAMC:0171]MCG7507049.1 hypothetical protein [Mesorhizobium sp. IRAMC:0171]
MWAAIVKWLTSSLVGQLTEAYKAKLAAQNDEQRLVAEAAIKQLEAEMQARAGAKEIRLATAGFWEMRVIAAVIAGCFALHLLLVTLDTCFSLGWRVAAFPAPFDQWEGTILLSFFGVQVAGQGITAIASAIRGRK